MYEVNVVLTDTKLFIISDTPSLYTIDISPLRPELYILFISVAASSQTGALVYEPVSAELNEEV